MISSMAHLEDASPDEVSSFLDGSAEDAHVIQSRYFPIVAR